MFAGNTLTKPARSLPCGTVAGSKSLPRIASRASMLAVRLNATTYPIEAVEQEELERADTELITIEGKMPDEILAGARDCDALIVVSSKVPAQVVEQLSKCRVIARLGA